ncbi:AAC(3) family N-acetyltransferase, partial [Streptomyces hainanensis]|uniref:AAC(3) family N-acetyltransferase n=1 Tax=Streptomyces hainanensis TaxID=402648 RepID=UPI001FB7B655
MAVSTSELVTAVDALGIAGRPVLAHVSLRSFGAPVASGADGLLDALLSRGCTVLVPSFSEPQFRVDPPLPTRPAGNGVDYSRLPWAAEPAASGPPYTVDCGLINATLGALPAALIARAEARRGRHPLNSFAAVGALADELVSTQSPTDVYAPLRKLVEHDGVVLLVGVGLNRMTLLHLAEQRSGRRLFVRWALGADGRVITVEVGSCSEGFPRFEPHLRGLAGTVTVGVSGWAAYPAGPVLDAAVAAIANERDITRCSDAGCLACRDAVAGGPVGVGPLG